MKVFVKFAGPLRSAAGVKQVEIDVDSEATTGSVLHLVSEKFPGIERELFGPEPKGYYSVFVNDRLVPEKSRPDVRVHEGDEVLFLLPIAGGAQMEAMLKTLIRIQRRVRAGLQE